MKFAITFAVLAFATSSMASIPQFNSEYRQPAEYRAVESLPAQVMRTVQNSPRAEVQQIRFGAQYNIAFPQSRMSVAGHELSVPEIAYTDLFPYGPSPKDVLIADVQQWSASGPQEFLFVTIPATDGATRRGVKSVDDDGPTESCDSGERRELHDLLLKAVLERLK